VRTPRYGSARIRLVPDDCVKELLFDDKPLPIPKDASACDVVVGFPVDLPPSSVDVPKRRRDHQLQVRILNLFGPGAIDVRPELGSSGYGCLAGAFLSLLALLYLWYGPVGLRMLLRKGQALRLGTVLSWRRVERILLALYLASRVGILWARWGLLYGHDAGYHLEMVKRQPWWGPFPRLDACFYCYHPPLGFWMAKGVALTGLRPSMAVQTVSAVWMLVAFFSLRATVRWLRALDRPWGIAFLYFTSSMPLMTYLGSAQTLDSIIYGWAAVILYVSVRLTWARRGDTESSSWRRWLGWAGLAAMMALAMLTKFSAVLLLSFPVISALLARRRVWRRMRSAVVACVLAVALVFPYYYLRNYRQKQTFFPANTTWLVADAVKEAQRKRDEDRVKFILAMLTPSAVDPEHPEVFDPKIPRLHDVWRYFWIGSNAIGAHPPSTDVSRYYLVWAPWICAAGVVALLRRRRRLLLWLRAGALFAAIAAVEVVALSKLCYDVAFAGWVYTKAIYIAPAAWLLGYLMTLVITERWWLPHVLGSRWRLGKLFSLLLIATFLGINSWYMVY
jgi:4-amino-4-deoxy-L-arabinose transferase-like glycosyltransferase